MASNNESRPKGKSKEKGAWLKKMANYQSTMTDSTDFATVKAGDNSHEVISIITPVYNEEENIPELYENIRRVMEQLGRPWELIFVDDGSRDQSPNLM